MLLAAESRTIEAPIGRVWAVTSSFGVIEAWMPTVISVSIEGAGVGAIRTVQTQNGEARETLLEVDPLNYRVRFSIQSARSQQIAGFVSGSDLSPRGERATHATWIAEASAVTGDIDMVREFLRVRLAENLSSLAAFLGAEIHAG